MYKLIRAYEEDLADALNEVEADGFELIEMWTTEEVVWDILSKDKYVVCHALVYRKDTVDGAA